MEKRYERMERFFVRNVKTYNEKVKQLIKEGETEFNGEPLELFPYIVLVINETSQFDGCRFKRSGRFNFAFGGNK